MTTFPGFAFYGFKMNYKDLYGSAIYYYYQYVRLTNPIGDFVPLN